MERGGLPLFPTVITPLFVIKMTNLFLNLHFSGMEVRRIISEPTAAALAYGLHKKKGVEYIVVVDLGKSHLNLYQS